PARGSIRVDGRRSPIADGALACLDWGRGVWPARTSWNWASASGVSHGRVVGMNLGARWTDGSGVNENALLVDGRLTKIHGDVRFDWDRRAPRRTWTIRSTTPESGDAVDLSLEPEVLDGATIPGIGRLCVAFGTFRGSARAGGEEA